MFCTRLGRRGLYSLVVCLCFAPSVYAGDGVVITGSRIPVCARGNCQPGPSGAVQLQGTLLQAAALSVALGPGQGPMKQRRMKELSGRSRARLPSWYKRAQAAQVHQLAQAVGKTAAVPAQSVARARVREPVPASVAHPSPSRERLRPVRTLSMAATPASARSTRAGRSGTQARAARHRELVQDALEQMLETEERQARMVRSSSPSPTPLGSGNFTRSIRQNPKGHYSLAGPVAINSTDDLPLGNQTHPFTGTVTGTAETPLQLDLCRSDGENLALFGGLDRAKIRLTLNDSSLVNTNGSVALFGGRMKNSQLDLTVHNSHLTAAGSAHHAALVEESLEGNRLNLSMTDTHITATRNAGMPGRKADRLVAGPVAWVSGSENALFVSNSHGNRVEARVNGNASSLAVASLGWGYVNNRTADNDLCQRNISKNTVQADVQAQGGEDLRAHASLAGSYGPGKTLRKAGGSLTASDLHNLEQWAVNNNRIEARVTEVASRGTSVASLGMVYDALPGEFFSAWLGVHIRQQRCSGNHVKAEIRPREPRAPRKKSMAMASLAVETDDSQCGDRCCRLHSQRFGCPREMPGFVCKECAPVSFVEVLQSHVSDNAVTSEGVGLAVRSKTLVGFLGWPDRRQNPCQSERISLFLFSGGNSSLPLFMANSDLVRCLNDASENSIAVVDRAGYSFAPVAGTGLPDRFVKDSTHTEGWKDVNKAYCAQMHDVFEKGLQRIAQCRMSSCGNTTVCHSPGEQFQALVPVSQQGRDPQWLLVTRQTWPDGSSGNNSNTDVFRVVPFARPGSIGDDPVLQSKITATTAGYVPAGSVYNGTRVLPNSGGPLQAMAVNDANEILHLVFEDTSASSVNLTRLALDERRGRFDSTSWQPPSGGQLMLLSNEEDGVNVWIRRNGTVERWSLADMEHNATNATETIRLSPDEDPPLALARDGDFLYSLHNATTTESSGTQPLRVLRWNLKDARPTDNWWVNWPDPPSGRLTARHCTLRLEPENGIVVDQGNETAVLRPQVPEDGGCLSWDRVTTSLAALTLCDAGTARATAVASSAGDQPSSTAMDSDPGATTTAALASAMAPTSTLAMAPTSTLAMAPTSTLATAPTSTLVSSASSVSKPRASGTSGGLVPSAQGTLPVFPMSSAEPDRPRMTLVSSTGMAASSGFSTASVASMTGTIPSPAAEATEVPPVAGPNANAAASVLLLLVPAGAVVVGGGIAYKYWRKGGTRQLPPGSEQTEMQWQEPGQAKEQAQGDSGHQSDPDDDIRKPPLDGQDDEVEPPPAYEDLEP